MLQPAEIRFRQLVFEQGLFLRQPTRAFFKFLAKGLQDMQRLLTRRLGQLAYRTIDFARGILAVLALLRRELRRKRSSVGR